MNQPLSPAEIAALLRCDLGSFILRSFLELNPSVKYLHNWHIDLIAAKLNEVRTGKCKRLIINIPPRYMKSICASVALPAWLLGHDPTVNIICASYGQDLANKLAMDCRTIMQTAWYQELFPGTRLSPVKNAVHDFRTTKQGGRMSTSVGGVLTGRGADILILDDLVNAKDAMSESQRVSANEWFDGTAYSRLNSKEYGVIINIMQRLHLDDLVGHIMDKETWDSVSLPAIAEEEAIYRFDTAFGPQIITRKAGEALHAERESLEVLSLIRAALGEYNFAGQYQQSPVPLGGGFIKTDWLNYLEPHEFPTEFDSIIQSWDTACKASELSDYSVCTTWGEKDKKYYLLGVWRKRVDYPDLKRAALELNLQYKPNAILIEDKSSGTQLIQELKEQGIYIVQAVKPEGDKTLRLLTQSPLFESGRVILPKTANWLMDYVQEITSFPTAKYDDQVDSTTQALAYLRRDFPGAGLLEWYRMEHEKLQN